MNLNKSLLLLTFAVCLPAQAMDPAQQMRAYMALSQGNYAVAVPALKKLADEGDAQSQATLGTVLWTGMPGVPQDRASAIEYYERAAQKYNGSALAALGNIYLNGDSVPRDTKKAFEYLSKSITQGTNTGKIGLAVCYLKGWGTEQDLQKSFMYTREAAMQKVPGAAYNIAYYYRRGIGCNVDMAEANKWFQKAAPMVIREAYDKRSSYEHQIAVAEMYTNGWGVAKDPKKAAAYFAVGLPLLKQAMAANKTNAIMTMAELMKNGWGVKKDVAGAELLYKKAAEMGDKEAEWVLSSNTHAQ